MRKECEEAVQAGQPALIVTYGNTTRKHRPLDRDVTLLGRAPSCDISLASPEVAPVHCVILHTPEGWRIRDCSGGRHATRLNGQAVHEEPLRDTDVLQVGTFSFEFHLPNSRPTPVPGSTPVVDQRLAQRVQRLQRSRRKLVGLALKLRQRAGKSTHLPPTLAELERQAECLRGLQRDYETLVKEYESRLADLEQVEREVCDERAEFERERTERQTKLEKAEHELVREQAEVEARLKARWEECQERCRQAEQAHAHLAQGLSASDAATAMTREMSAVLDRRSQELNYFARHLRRSRRQLLERTPPPQSESEPESRTERDLELARAQEEASRWREQYQALQAELAALDAQAQQRHDELSAARDKAQVEADTTTSTVRELKAISESLRREIQDRDVVMEKLRRQVDQQSAQTNVEHSGSYERELNQFRVELEQDRQELNEQICQLQVRQAEMESAAREAELQMSRDRAVIARERAELTRLRDEIRIAKDRTVREGGLRERLSNIHRLKQELAKTNSEGG
jgi:pSer/pThr/pTyr-binding forkhead associated (FHA) protein